MAGRPSGTVTFLFSDVEGSTQLLGELGPDRYRGSVDPAALEPEWSAGRSMPMEEAIEMALGGDGD